LVCRNDGLDGSNRKIAVKYDLDHVNNLQGFNGIDEPSDARKSPVGREFES
jgi:hypothetical protein